MELIIILMAMIGAVIWICASWVGDNPKRELTTAQKRHALMMKTRASEAAIYDAEWMKMFGTECDCADCEAGRNRASNITPIPAPPQGTGGGSRAITKDYRIIGDYRYPRPDYVPENAHFSARPRPWDTDYGRGMWKWIDPVTGETKAVTVIGMPHLDALNNMARLWPVDGDNFIIPEQDHQYVKELRKRYNPGYG